MIPFSTLAGIPYLSLRYLAVLCVLVLSCRFVFAAEVRRDELHKHLYQTVSNKRLSVERRQALLLAHARNDHERAWLIYRWVTHHFKHDKRLAALIGDPGEQSLDSLFQAGGGSCAVFANVLHRLLQNAGLEVKTIYGVAKGGASASIRNGMRVNHVWNAVRLGGVWYLMDATWGAGYVDRDGFHSEPTDLFFMVPPHRAVLSHFDPTDQHGYQAKLGVTQEKFQKIADDATYVAAVGFDATSILQLQVGRQARKLVDTFNPVSNAFRVIEAPLGSRLNKKMVKIRIESAVYEELMVLQGKRWTPMRKNGVSYSIDYLPTKGELLVMARREKEHEFEALLGYSVK